MNEQKVTEKQLKEICKMGQASECCSFLMWAGDTGFCCAKGSTLEPMILERRFLETLNAMGDNCSGPPDFMPN